MDITMSISFILNNYVQEYPRHQCISSSSNIKFQKKKVFNYHFLFNVCKTQYHWLTNNSLWLQH